jgi:hypothetical protein
VRRIDARLARLERACVGSLHDDGEPIQVLGIDGALLAFSVLREQECARCGRGTFFLTAEAPHQWRCWPACGRS